MLCSYKTIHLDSFLDKEVNIDFYTFETEKILKIADNLGFKIIDIVERYPYNEKDHPQ